MLLFPGGEEIRCACKVPPVNLPGAPCALPAVLANWPAAINALDEVSRAALGPWLVREWVEGRLESILSPAGSITEVRSQLANVIRELGGRDVLEVEWRGTNVDAEGARRWCWIEPWILLSQDEDLLLMGDHLVAPLLEEAAAGCPKKSYARQIAAHHLRDQAHGKLRSGPEAVRAHLLQLNPFVTSARETGDHSLVEYLERLQSYAKPSRVSREAALERVTDLWRCHPPTKVDLEETSAQWRAQLSTRPQHEEWIVIDRRFGTMWIDAPGQTRAERKGRR